MFKFLKDLTVVQEMIAILSIPIIAIIILEGVSISQDVDHYQKDLMTSEILSMHHSLSDVITQVREERLASVQYVSKLIDKDKLEESHRLSDKAFKNFKAHLEMRLQKNTTQQTGYDEKIQALMEVSQNKIFLTRIAIVNETTNAIDTVNSLFEATVPLREISFLLIHQVPVGNSVDLTVLPKLELMKEYLGMTRGLATATVFQGKGYGKNLKDLCSYIYYYRQLARELERNSAPSDLQKWLEIEAKSQVREAYVYMDRITQFELGATENNLPSIDRWKHVMTSYVMDLNDLATYLAQNLQQQIDDSLVDDQKSIAYDMLIALAMIGISVYLSYISINGMREQFDLLKNGLEAISNRDLRKPIPLDGDDEFGSLSQVINTNLLKSSLKIVFSLKDFSMQINNSVKNLSGNSQRIMAAANQQNAAVKEVVSTMEDNNQMSRQILTKITQVKESINHSQIAFKDGFYQIEETKNMMNLISESSENLIAGIKLLNQQINAIWEVVNVINSIAEQTKIIAFNAEIEAASAGESGKNFQIVATEIRRLADNTVISTDEIRKKINDIQRSSDQLIIRAEEGTTRVVSGQESMLLLNKIFEKLNVLSENTVVDANNVSTAVSQQVVAFDQIVQTMKQISDAVKEFSQTTTHINDLAQILQKTSGGLSEIVQSYEVPEINREMVVVK